MKKIGNYITNDYIDLFYKDGKINRYYKSNNTIDDSNININYYYEIFKKNIELSKYFVDSSLNISEIEHTDLVYAINGILTPIRLYELSFNNGKEVFEDILIINIVDYTIMDNEVLYEKK